MFCMWIYGLPVIAGMLGGGVEAAVPAVGLCFSGYALIGSLLTFAHPWLFARVPAGLAHGAALLVGATGMAVLGSAVHAVWLFPAFGALAVCWSSMGAVPYAAAAAAALPGHGAATMRKFSFSTVVPQVATTFGLAFLAERWGVSSNTVILLGAAELAVAGLLTLHWHRWIIVPGQNW